MGADRAETFLAKQVDDDDREREVTEAYDIDGWTGFDFPGRKGKVHALRLSSPTCSCADLSSASSKPLAVL